VAVVSTCRESPFQEEGGNFSKGGKKALRGAPNKGKTREGLNLQLKKRKDKFLNKGSKNRKKRCAKSNEEGSVFFNANTGHRKIPSYRRKTKLTPWREAFQTE